MCMHSLVCNLTDDVKKSASNAYVSIYCDVYWYETVLNRRFKATVFVLCPRAV